MKKVIYILLFVLAVTLTSAAQKADKKKSQVKTSVPAETIEREKFDPLRNPSDDLAAAVTKAQVENKRIILDVGGEWCGWCRLMDNYLIKNVELGKLRDDNYIWVKVNMSDENENKEFLSKYPEINGYPHLFVLEKDGTLIKSKETSELEDGKSYNLQKFTGFLKEYAPVKNSDVNIK